MHELAFDMGRLWHSTELLWDMEKGTKGEWRSFWLLLFYEEVFLAKVC